MKPVRVQDLMAYLPHRPPMVWVDEVIEVTPEGGVCRLVVKESALYWGPHGFDAPYFIELMAQGYGFVSVVQALQGLVERAGAAQEAYLVGARNVQFTGTPCEVGSELLVSVKKQREFPPLLLFAGEVKRADGTPLAHGNLKIYFKS